MYIEEAIKEVKSGKRMRAKQWDKNRYIFMSEKYVGIKENYNGNIFTFTPSPIDWISDKWECYD